MSLSSWAPIFRISILISISLLSILIRLFSFIRYESIIHEYDPWFNYRSTLILQSKGLYEFWNWFDESSWYPLGRAVGATVYPGMMLTSYFCERLLSLLGVEIDMRNICVFLAPVFSALSAVASYLLASEATGKPESGLFAALFTGLVPAYISRSVAGSYDNEGVSIFAMIFTFYLYVKALNTGSAWWAGLAALSYFYMVLAWGGYVFIINVVPIFVLGSVLVKRYSDRLYVSYSVFYVFASILAMNVQVVNYHVVKSSEHLASHVVFVVLQIYVFLNYLKETAGKDHFRVLVKVLVVLIVVCAGFYTVFMFLSGNVKWSGRSLTLLNPTDSDFHVPLIESVAEHSPTGWANFYTDLQYLLIFSPAGLYYCLTSPSPGKLFLAVYTLLSVYFASVMIRLLLVMAPAVCIMSAIGLSETLHTFTRHIKSFIPWLKCKDSKPEYGFPIEVSIGVLAVISLTCISFISHSVWSSSENYSNPQIYLSNWFTGERKNVDDFREAYYWMRMNTPEDSKVLAWWDYGYQITGNANRSVIVDNNTWNNSHIATVGMIFASNEEEAARQLRKIDTEYVFVVFGGFAHYLSDDMGKFYWMVRIAADVFPFIKVEDYNYRGEFRVDKPTDTLKQSLIYKLSYYRFGEVGEDRTGFDRVRETEIGWKDFNLKHFEEVFTSENWIVRIYKVKAEGNRNPVRSSSIYVKNDEEMMKFKLNRAKLTNKIRNKVL